MSYESFLFENVSAISTFESTLRSLTWLLPGRFKDAELASESLSASLNLMSMYHDTLLTRILHSDPKYRPLIPTSLHTRFTRAWSDKDSLYKWAARALEIIRFTELLIEMGLRRRVKSKTKWRTIVVIETIKACLRFLLLRITRRPVLSPPIPERDLDVSSLPPRSAELTSAPATSSPASSPLATPDHLRNNLLPLQPHPLLTAPPPTLSDTSVEDYLLPKALSSASLRSSLSLVKPFSCTKDWVSEFIYILRPLVYVVVLLLDRQKRRGSNRALTIVIMMELISRNLRRKAAPSASLERSEYGRRDRDLLRYIFRGTMWTDFTRPKVEALAARASHAPFLSLLSAIAKDWIPLIDEYYYYTAP